MYANTNITNNTKPINPIEIQEIKTYINKTKTSLVTIDYKCTNIKAKYTKKLEKLNNGYVHPTTIKFFEARLQKRPGLEDLAKSIETEIFKLEEVYNIEKISELQTTKDNTKAKFEEHLSNVISNIKISDSDKNNFVAITNSLIETKITTIQIKYNSNQIHYQEKKLEKQTRRTQGKIKTKETELSHAKDHNQETDLNHAAAPNQNKEEEDQIKKAIIKETIQKVV
ncbi:hypothetical protein BB561_006967 [Smittium simulii]|uniref:Uncharacterized protein n=1 Tax=Smittium simulii TaxID=133385 RepID=A0A2T9XYZ3_9FUNG|nr:hypothetical protein BB561_006967 [Smittium simulii]